MKVYFIAEISQYDDVEDNLFYEGYLSAQDAYAITLARLKDDYVRDDIISEEEYKQQIFKLNETYKKYLTDKEPDIDKLFYCNYYKVIEREIKK